MLANKFLIILDINLKYGKFTYTNMYKYIILSTFHAPTIQAPRNYFSFALKKPLVTLNFTQITNLSLPQQISVLILKECSSYSKVKPSPHLVLILRFGIELKCFHIKMAIKWQKKVIMSIFSWLLRLTMYVTTKT